MKIRNFEPEDLERIDAIEPAPIDDGDKIKEGALAVSVDDDEGVIGCGGVVFIDGWAELWVLLDKRAKETPVRAIEAISAGYRTIRASVKEPIFCRCKRDFAQGQRLIEWLGFERVQEKNGYIMYTEK